MAYLLHHYLRDSARRHPDSIAIVEGDRSMSYGELDRRSDNVAARLVELGIERGDRVGVYLPKSTEAVIGIYAAMKSGAAYVPIDPSAPRSRVAYIAQNCGIRHVISGSAKRASWASLAGAGVEHILALDTDDSGEDDSIRVHTSSWLDQGGVANDPGTIDQDLAYILYTSGSTGDPKGVMLSHLNCRGFVEWAVDEYSVTSVDRLSSHAPFHFDLSTFDLFGAALAGAPVYLVPPKASVFPVEIVRFIDRHQITVWYSVPSILTMLTERAGLEQGALPSLRTILFAGEVFPTKYLSRIMRLLPHVAFANLFGPTETNVCTSYRVPEPPDEDGPTISIGKAIGNVETFVVDEADAIVEPGAAGELLVRGPTVMRGYWGDSERTATRLVASPIDRHVGDPVYRTGDLVQEMADGNYRFLGRSDDQIKSRGYRIELGDIEAALVAHPDVVGAAALAIPDDMISNRIIAYVAVSGEVDTEQVKVFCAGRIQKYMVPEAILVTKELPMTSTGKLDRQTLVRSYLSLDDTS
ncbi:MAG: amino acid adenylation domain-containing protein [Acidimicrobiia bacterium]